MPFCLNKTQNSFSLYFSLKIHDHTFLAFWSLLLLNVVLFMLDVIDPLTLPDNAWALITRTSFFSASRRSKVWKSCQKVGLKWLTKCVNKGSLKSITVFKMIPLKKREVRRPQLMVSALNSGVSGLSLSPGWGHCVEFLSKTLNSHGASVV